MPAAARSGVAPSICRERPPSVACKWRQELSGIIAQCFNLEHEIRYTASKLCILGFEPLKQSLMAAFGDISTQTASWWPSTLTGHLQAQHISYPL